MDLIKQLASFAGTVFAAACCLGLPLVLSALGALGLGFLIHDAILIPLLVGFIALNLWLLRGSARRHGAMAPFWLALAGGVLAVAGLFVHAAVPILGLSLLLGASLWDFVNGRAAARCASP